MQWALDPSPGWSLARCSPRAPGPPPPPSVCWSTGPPTCWSVKEWGTCSLFGLVFIQRTVQAKSRGLLCIRIWVGNKQFSVWGIGRRFRIQIPLPHIKGPSSQIIILTYTNNSYHCLIMLEVSILSFVASKKWKVELKIENWILQWRSPLGQPSPPFIWINVPFNCAWLVGAFLPLVSVSRLFGKYLALQL